MSAAALTALIARCRALCRPRSDDTDSELLRRFTQQRDTAAFEELLERHAVLVWGVCRRILRSEADCEDAFQATFLALVRRPATLPSPKLGEGIGVSLAAWLHTVALRVARKARARVGRQHPQVVLPERATAGDVADEVGSREMFRMVDEEIERLPTALRLPLLMCCLQGRTRDEAAEALGCSVAAVKGRLERGRDLLRRNLRRRGVELPAAFLVLGLTGERIYAALWTKTMQSALHVPAPAIASLAEAGASAVTIGKGKLFLAALLLASSAVGAAGSLLRTKPLEPPPADEATVAPAKKSSTPQAHTDRHGDPLPEGAVARLGTVRFRMSGLVYACALSPDGKILAASSVDEAIALFDAATGRPLRQLPGNSYSATSLAFAPDSKTLAVGYTRGSIVLWNCETAKMVRQFVAEVGGPIHPVRSLTFTPDGKGLLSAGEDKVVRLWDPAAGKEVRRFSGHQNEVRCAALSSDGKILASAAGDDICLWETASGKMIRRLTGHKKSIRALAISASGKLLASGDQEGTIHLWETATGAVRHRIRENAKRQQWAATRHAHALAFSPDGQILAVGRADYSLNLWDAVTGNELHDIEGTGFNVYTGGTYHDGGIQCAVFSRDGKRLVFSRDNALAWLDVKSGTEISLFPIQRGAVRRMIFRSDGKRLLMTSADPDRGILEWDTASGRPIQRPAGPGLYRSLNCFSSDGKMAATADNSELHLWDTMTGKEVRRIFLPLEKNNSNAIQEASFSPDGKRLAVAGPLGNSAWLFDASTGKLLQSMGPGKNWTFVHARFSADSRLVAIVGNEAIQFVGASSDWPRPSITLSKECISFASALSPDGRTLALASGEYLREKNSIFGSYPGSRPPGSPPPGVLKVRELSLWETASGKKRGTVPSPCSRVHGLTFSPDGRLLAIAGDDRAVHVWDTVKGEWLRHWQGHRGEVEALVFSPDGRRLASGSKDTTALIWDVSRLAKETRRCAPLPRQALEELWSTLAGADALKAYRAILTLESVPDQSVPLLAERLRFKPSADAKRRTSLIAQLDSEDFAQRERATAELRRLGWEAEPALLKVLENKPSLETRQRVKALLDEIRKQAPPPQLLRMLRGIEVLERIGGEEARKAIASFADGPTRLAREAKAALDRQKNSKR
jgi:RNA polymerase sigma factor (sigma-70 family)